MVLSLSSSRDSRHRLKNKKMEKNNLNIEPAFSESRVIEHNLKMLDLDMARCLMEESFGGNAGNLDLEGTKYSCGAANGYANYETGEIVVFDNPQNLDKEIVQNNVPFILRVALSRNFKLFKIVNFIGAENFSTNGRLAIEVAINRWNDAHQSDRESGNLSK